LEKFPWDRTVYKVTSHQLKLIWGLTVTRTCSLSPSIQNCHSLKSPLITLNFNSGTEKTYLNWICACVFKLPLWKKALKVSLQSLFPLKLLLFQLLWWENKHAGLLIIITINDDDLENLTLFYLAPNVIHFYWVDWFGHSCVYAYEYEQLHGIWNLNLTF